jgi:S-(hydroxymethyl)glutathione dehydrogenase / alcohol dehydrogenase
MPQQIRATVLNSAPGRLEIADLILGDPGRGEVLVRVEYAGLCHSDLHELDGTFATTPPIVLGHEAAGVVEAIGPDVSAVVPGDYVVTCLSVFCGRCEHCLSGRLVLCANRTRTAMGSIAPRLTDGAGREVRPMAGIGAFAEKAVVHQNGLAVIPKDMPLAQASILGCAITTGYGAVVHRAGVRPGSSVVVVGVGGVGMAAVQAARISGAATIVAVDVSESKLALARSFGATATVDARSCDPAEAVRALTSGGADHAFEAVGRARTVQQAVAMLRPGGVATVVGMVPSIPPIELDGAELFFAEKTLQGSFMGSNRFPTDIPTFVSMYRGGRLDLDAMITDIVDFESINDGFDRLRAGDCLRVVVRIGRP